MKSKIKMGTQKSVQQIYHQKPIHKQYSNTTIYKTLSGKVVLSAVAVNGTNFIVKLVGWIYSGFCKADSRATVST